MSEYLCVCMCNTISGGVGWRETKEILILNCNPCLFVLNQGLTNIFCKGPESILDFVGYMVSGGNYSILQKMQPQINTSTNEHGCVLIKVYFKRHCKFFLAVYQKTIGCHN